MSEKFIYTLRYLAATLITLSGIGHVAALWLRPLTEIALLDALLGAVYLVIGIGLFGRSRFSLFIAIVLPAAMSGLILHTVAEPGPVFTVRIAVDAAVALCCVLVLWHVRSQPTT